jgi:hypothetical protein
VNPNGVTWPVNISDNVCEARIDLFVHIPSRRDEWDAIKAVVKNGPQHAVRHAVVKLTYLVSVEWHGNEPAPHELRCEVAAVSATDLI